MSAAAIAFVTAFLDALPQIIAAGADVASYIAQVKAVIDQGGDPTPAQWATLNAQIQADTAAV